MNVMEKLIALLAGCPCESDFDGMVGYCSNRKNGNCNEIFKLSYCAVTKLAQHLIKNGVTVRDISIAETVEENFRTNGDRIRSMSDKELAQEIYDAQSGITIKNPKNMDYLECVLEWLNQPYKEDKNETD